MKTVRLLERRIGDDKMGEIIRKEIYFDGNFLCRTYSNTIFQSFSLENSSTSTVIIRFKRIQFSLSFL